MMRKMTSVLIGIGLSAASALALADGAFNITNTVKEAPKVAPSLISDLGWMDRSQMDKQATKINDLTLTKLGTPIRGDLSDLATLQRLIDGRHVKMDDVDTQMAMGLVMGNVLLADFPQTLEWKIYEDELGRSRALCVKQAKECFFPMTMLSRRMQVGSQPNVREIYDNAILLMEEHLPKIPYGGGIYYRLPRPQ